MPRLYGNQSLSKNTMQGITYPTDPFGDLRVIQRQNQLDLKSTFGISALRDVITSTSGATTTFTGSEYTLQTTTTTDSKVVFQSRQRGRYQSGTGAEAAIGIRLPSDITGNHVVKFGLFDGIDGFYYQYDKTNKLSVNILNSSSLTQIVQSNFNIDTLNGKGPSGLTHDITKGSVYRCIYGWNGFGTVVFLMTMTDTDGSQCIIPVHQVANASQPICATPNLPLRVELNNNGSNTAASVYVCGRQYSNIGTINPPQRITSCVYENGAGLTINATTFIPIIAIRKKTGFYGTHILLRCVDFLTNTKDAFYRLILNPTLTGGTWATPLYTDAAETAVEVSQPTSFTNGITVLMGVLDSTVYQTINENGILITDNDTLLVTAKSLSGNASISFVSVKLTEEW